MWLEGLHAHSRVQLLHSHLCIVPTSQMCLSSPVHAANGSGHLSCATPSLRCVKFIGNL